MAAMGGDSRKVDERMVLNIRWSPGRLPHTAHTRGDLANNLWRAARMLSTQSIQNSQTLVRVLSVKAIETIEYANTNTSTVDCEIGATDGEDHELPLHPPIGRRAIKFPLVLALALTRRPQGEFE